MVLSVIIMTPPLISHHLTHWHICAWDMERTWWNFNVIVSVSGPSYQTMCLSKLQPSVSPNSPEWVNPWWSVLHAPRLTFHYLQQHAEFDKYQSFSSQFGQVWNQFSACVCVCARPGLTFSSVLESVCVWYRIVLPLPSEPVTDSLAPFCLPSATLLYGIPL